MLLLTLTFSRCMHTTSGGAPSGCIICSSTQHSLTTHTISRVASNASCVRHKGYSVGSEKAAIKQDVLQMFVDSANAAGVGYGFYYSIMKNFFLCHSFSGTNSCMQEVLPGQHNYTQEEYTAVVKQQVCVCTARRCKLARGHTQTLPVDP
jgi:hypothetical protein